MASTIKDIARLSGVSIGTVDRVLHNRGRVSPESQKAVLKEIEELDYRPNTVARALVSKRNPIRIGISYPMVDKDFWMEAGIGIEKARKDTEDMGVDLIVNSFPTYSIKDQIASIDKLVEHDVNAIIIAAIDDSFSEKIDKHIPENIPYATVINDTVSTRRMFFQGPDDFSLGRLMAKLVSLYINSNCEIAILSPNTAFTGMQQRISGFLSKVNQDSLDIHIRRMFPIDSIGSEKEVFDNVYNAVMTCINDHSGLNAMYITNGLLEPAAKALTDAGKAKKILLFGHEYTENLPKYIREGVIGASIYQKPAMEWYQAILLMFEFLSGKRHSIENIPPSECSIIIKETLPFIKVGELCI